MKQLISGHIIDGLYRLFKLEELDKVKALCYSLSYFNVESKSRFEEKMACQNPMHCVLINILERGIPTLVQKNTLDFFVNKSSILEQDFYNEAIVNVNFKKDYKDLLFRSLHIIDPRLEVNDMEANYIESWEKLGSSYEENFLFKELPSLYGKVSAILVQLLAQQRSIDNIVNGDEPESLQENFKEQRCDFAVSFPYYKNSKGLVVEIDGRQHEEWAQKKLDGSRDKAVAKAKWSPTVRIKTSDFGTKAFANKMKQVSERLNEEYVKQVIQNYKEPIWLNSENLEAFQLTLSPFAVARMQRVLIEFLSKNTSLSSKNKLKVAVLERDVPCADIAIQELQKTVEALNALSHTPISLPEIELEVFATDEFIDSIFRIQEAKSFAEFDTEKEYDLLIDISVLRRFISNEFYNANASEIICISSSHYQEVNRKVKTHSLMAYKTLCTKDGNGDKWINIDKEAEQGLEYFLYSIFRKTHFREGQLPILNQALNCKSVIGLLPTGGGKSLTYQIAAFLQPGICLVIDPIKSLMKDQVDGLRRYCIDSCQFINSSSTGEEKRKYLRQMSAGELQFVFVSPERLQMSDFRDTLCTMKDKEVFFSYCVIDEAHCVSEWGHDFRTAYLRLGENAMKFCTTKNLDSLPLFGLTATASYDVLADVQRELSGSEEITRLKEDAIIRSEFSKRDELQFVIDEISVDNIKAYKDIFSLKEELGEAKKDRCLELIHNMPDELESYKKKPNKIYDNQSSKSEELFRFQCITDLDTSHFFDKENGLYKNAGIVFCPHKKGHYGVTDFFEPPGKPQVGVYDYLNKDAKIDPTFFVGSSSENNKKVILDEDVSMKNQQSFIENKSNLMVATKAFGMGIDKDNIRYVIHLNYPSSIESYVQEAGRAGRDGKLALSYILYNGQEFNVDGEKIDHDYEINKYFHDNSFKGIVKEKTILDQLMTEVFFKDKASFIEGKIKEELKIDISCTLWEKPGVSLIYIKNQDKEDIGYINANTLSFGTKDSPDPKLFKKIYACVLTMPEAKPGKFLPWFKKPILSSGILEHLSKINIGESFSLTIGFSNDTESVDRIVFGFIAKWIPFYAKKEKLVINLKKKNAQADTFIAALENDYLKNTGDCLDFEAVCLMADRDKKNPSGYAYEQFGFLYNGKREKSETEKAIYRLMVLGVIDDYTVNYAAKTFTIECTKKSDDQYTNHLKAFLLKYYSEQTTNSKLEELNKIEEPNQIKKLFKFYVNFIYDEVKKKREQAVKDMRYACENHIDKPKELKEYIDLYFNSKYARKDFKCELNGQIINASLSDRTDEGKENREEWIWEFIKIIDNDKSGGGEIDNIKHLRGACTRMLNSQQDNFVLLILNAFSLYNLEYKNQKQLQEAENLLTRGVMKMSEDVNYTDESLQVFFNKFAGELHKRIPNLQKYLDKYGMELDIDNLLVSRYMPYLKKSNSALRKLINQLN